MGFIGFIELQILEIIFYSKFGSLSSMFFPPFFQLKYKSARRHTFVFCLSQKSIFIPCICKRVKQQFKCSKHPKHSIGFLKCGADVSWNEKNSQSWALSLEPSAKAEALAPQRERGSFAREHTYARLLFLSGSHGIKRATAREHSWATPQDVWRRRAANCVSISSGFG